MEEAKEHQMDVLFKCIICMDNTKNVSFADGCDHIVFCNQCESARESAGESKKCPICDTTYTKTKSIRF